MTRRNLLLVLVLVTVATSSAMGVVYSKYSSRQLFVELQGLRAERDRLDTEWGRLQLEIGAWATHGRVERLARDELNMRLPRPSEVVVLQR